MKLNMEREISDMIIDVLFHTFRNDNPEFREWFMTQRELNITPDVLKSIAYTGSNMEPAIKESIRDLIEGPRSGAGGPPPPSHSSAAGALVSSEA